MLRQENIKALFQPIIHLQTRQIYGYEGLIRGPVNTILHAPTRLFEAATSAGRLAELDLLCRRVVIKRFAQLGLSGRLFINVDPSSLAHETFREGVTLELIEQAGINPSQVIIELTETRPVEDVQLMRQAMIHYRKMGFRVALDDLGAGYSGLKLWSEIRPDIVKIDRHFIQGIDEDRTKQQFVIAILKTATALGARVITEGVETEREYATLRKIGVEMVQGYYFCRPVEVPPTAISSGLFRKEVRSRMENGDSPTVEKIIRPAISVQANTKFLEVGEIFTSRPELESIVIVHDQEVLGLVLRREFMNSYASLYGKELFRKFPAVRFLNNNVMQVDKKLALEEVSFRLTTSLDLYTEEFIILDDCRLAGKGRLIDLLHEITKLQVNRAQHANPLTLLPGNVPIQQELQRLFNQVEFFVVCYFDLDNFKPFNDFFGFSRGDKVLRFLADLLIANVDEQSDFIGHIGGDDFVVIFRNADWLLSVRRILRQFDESIGGYYNGQIGNNITTTDRDGTVRKYQQMTLSVGAVVVHPSALPCRIDLGEEAATAKHEAKAMPGTSLYIHEIGSSSLSQVVMEHCSLPSAAGQ
ncbi:bifunctional diguanylate cyclase/phosphodiesterase [Desulfobulbus alkaliphilus]|uniref:bifunctional diguanylate cyclase/phosphodiesterase n=1 Tax=Desulfobulbus alkaliphilus TaxID=869814 RepID=UPI00308430AD